MRTQPGAPSDEGDSAEHREELLDQQEEDSFPASDPHSDWAGPGDSART